MQIKACLMNYDNVINKCISDLKKLNDMKNKNEYLNVKKQFDGIISKGVDNIINFLNNDIKTPNMLTRTTIRTDVMITLSSTIENIINTANNDLTNSINKLAILNSTTINYKTMTKEIDDSRSKIENYVELDKLISKYGRNINKYNTNINDALNKSNILPIYEQNFDRIRQLLKSDYNDDETQLSNKYGKAYTDYLAEKKKDDLDVNPMRMASQIESGIVNMLSNLYGSKSSSKNYYGDSNGSNGDKDELIEQYNREYGNTQNNNDRNNNRNNNRNPLPSQQSKLVNNTRLNDNANIYNDRGNLGNYLIDKKTQKQILEGFANETTTTNPSSTKGARGAEALATTSQGVEVLATDYVKHKTKKKRLDIVSSLLSGDFFQYVMDVMNEKLNMLYGMYNTKFNNGKNSNDSYGNTDIYNNLKLEENMIPAGFLLFILSILFYFIDTTS